MADDRATGVGQPGLGDFWHSLPGREASLDIATDGAYMRIWDYSAVQILVEEAGGKCTTLSDTPPTDGDSLISTNGLLDREAIELLRPS